LAWNATLLGGDLAESVTALKDRHDRTLIAVGAGELTHALTTLGLVDEFWFWVSPSLWHAGPRIFDGVGPVRLELIGSTTLTLAWSGWPTGQHPAGKTAHPPRVEHRRTQSRFGLLEVLREEPLVGKDAETRKARVGPRPSRTPAR